MIHGNGTGAHAGGPEGPGTDALVRKLACFIDLSDREREVLRALYRDHARYDRHVELVRSGEACRDILLMREGWAIRYRCLETGERMIVSYVLPGDFVSLNAVLFDYSDFTVATITPVVVSRFSPDVLIELMAEFPRLALAIAWCDAREESILAEHLINVGRRSAYQRVAHLLLELLRRLELIGLARGGEFDLPISQSEVADGLGLSLSHVNRVMRRLHADGLIRMAARMDRHVAIVDRQALEKAAGFEAGYLHFTEMPRRLARSLKRVE